MVWWYFLQAQIVQLGARQQDRTVQHRRVDGDARAAAFSAAVRVIGLPAVPKPGTARCAGAAGAPSAGCCFSSFASVAWRACSACICGMAMKYCQPNRTAADERDGEEDKFCCCYSWVGLLR